MFCHRKSFALLATLAGLVAHAAPAQAVVVTSFDIQGRDMYLSDVAGAQGDTHVGNWNLWNNTGGDTDRAWTTTLTDKGTISGITATATRNVIPGKYTGGFNNNSRCCESDGDRLLMRFGMDMGDGGALPGGTAGPALTVTASNIPYATYDVYVYAKGKEGGIAQITLNGSQVKTLQEVIGANNIPDPESGLNYVESTSTAFSNAAEQGHYVKFSDVTGASFTFDVATQWRTQPTGFQIVDTSGAPAPVIQTLKWDFENGNLFDTTGAIGFAPTGNAFTGQPITYAGTDVNNPFGDGGSFLVRTDFTNINGSQSKPGDSQLGSMTTSSFLLGSDAAFTFEGAGNGGRLELIDAMTGAVLTFLAPSRTSTTLDQYVLDASAFAGQMVQLRVVDTSTGGWGHIAIDNINYSAAAAATAVPEPATGLLGLLGLATLAARRRRRA